VDRLQAAREAIGPRIWLSVDANGGFTISEMNYAGFGVVSSRHFNSNPSFLVGFIY